jgi:HK97 gp10 family phage protein
MAKRVHVDGAKEIQLKLKNIAVKEPKEIEKALVKAGLLVERDYKLNVSQAGLVDTGRWINSITHKEDDFGTDHPSVQVGATVKNPPYPLFHEIGTSKFPATPTLTPAYENNKEQIKQIIAEGAKKGAGL